MDESTALKLLFGNVTFLPITDEVIAAFVEKGAKESDLQEMRARGFMYCPERDSIISPPEINLPPNTASSGRGYRKERRKKGKNRRAA